MYFRNDCQIRYFQALIGSNAVLECTPPKGFPEPVVTWRKDEKDVNFLEESRYKLHPSGNFIIENVCFFINIFVYIVMMNNFLKE